ncbi:MAG TPA: GNAT family N-acetyltransferase [Ignavibacteria bacterium]|nr:GNAT family N-acetyltransferase [Ignavibacteria bacterium]
MKTEFDLQPILENELVKIQPLTEDDFERLFKVASDPQIWEQHPNKDRFKREVFKTFFEGAMESNGAFIVFDKKTNEVIGSSRYYGYSAVDNTVSIGYTFLVKDHWGTIYNRALKTLMLDHAFNFVDKVIFHIGALNVRSQKAILKLGAVKIDEVEMKYHGEEMKLNFVYQMEKEAWNRIK